MPASTATRRMKIMVRRPRFLRSAISRLRIGPKPQTSMRSRRAALRDTNLFSSETLKVNVATGAGGWISLSHPPTHPLR